MGTSSLYKGPKKTILLPDDYSEEFAAPNNSSVEVDNNQTNDEGNGTIQSEPSVSWQSARNSISKSVGRGMGSLRRAVSSYTKAVGGHKHAAKQATVARATTTRIISYFSGTSSEIRERFEKEGISFENKSTKEIFAEIRDVIAPVPNTIDDGWVNTSVTEAFNELLKDESIIAEEIDKVLNENLLQKLVCGTIKYYIYTKLIAQATKGLLKNKTLAEVQKFEKDSKLLIEGIVNAVVPDMLKSGVKDSEIHSKVTEIFEGCYKIMEGV